MYGKLNGPGGQNRTKYMISRTCISPTPPHVPSRGPAVATVDQQTEYHTPPTIDMTAAMYAPEEPTDHTPVSAEAHGHPRPVASVVAAEGAADTVAETAKGYAKPTRQMEDATISPVGPSTGVPKVAPLATTSDVKVGENTGKIGERIDTDTQPDITVQSGVDDAVHKPLTPDAATIDPLPADEPSDGTFRGPATAGGESGCVEYGGNV